MPSFAMCMCLGVLFCSGFLVAAESPAKQAEWIKAREQLRQGRQSLEKGAREDRQTRADKAAKIIQELLAKAPESGAGREDADLADLIAGVRFLSQEAAEPLQVALAALPATPDPSKAKSWNQLVEAKRKDLLRPTEALFKKALDAGVPSVARDCLDQALTFWPDHRDVRRNLSEVKAEGRWYGPRNQQRLKAGLIWDMQLGWIVGSARARYGAGEYFDVQDKAWTTMAAADAKRAVAASRWVIPTEHLIVQGTAPLAVMVDTANRLEEFYDRIFASYSGFFVKAGAKGGSDVKLLFGTSTHEPLVINVAKDKEAYRASLPPRVDAGWSAGMFIPSTRESYFYQGSVEVVYHEFTHQIMDVFTDGNRGPAWLTEGAAVYTQGPVFREGRMELGHLDTNSHLLMYIFQSQADQALPLAQLLQLKNGFAWSQSPTPDLNYPAAGAVVQFCMESEQRRYRADFLDFLRDSYRGETRGYELWEYLGMDYAAFEKRYGAWRKDFIAQSPDGYPAGGKDRP
jgi:hypothetical protein